MAIVRYFAKLSYLVSFLRYSRMFDAQILLTMTSNCIKAL